MRRIERARRAARDRTQAKAQREQKQNGSDRARDGASVEGREESEWTRGQQQQGRGGRRPGERRLVDRRAVSVLGYCAEEGRREEGGRYAANGGRQSCSGGEASGGEERPSGAGRSIEQRAGLARSLERWSRGVRRGCRGSRGRRGLWRRRNSRKKRVRADGRVGAWEQGGRRCRRAARRLVSRAAGPKGQQHGGRAGGRADT